MSLLGVSLEISELDELDDVSFLLSALGVLKGGLAVELLHLVELRVADSDDHDAQRNGAGRDEQVDDLLHVVDLAVREDHENQVVPGALLAVLRRDLLRAQQDRLDERRAGQVDALQRLLVLLEQGVDALDVRVLRVPVDREAVVDLLGLQLRELRNPAEPEAGDLLVGVVVEQQLAEVLDASLVLVRNLRVLVVKTANKVRVALDFSRERAILRLKRERRLIGEYLALETNPLPQLTDRQ